MTRFDERPRLGRLALGHEVPEYLRGRSRDGWLGPVAIGGLLCLLCLLVWQSIGSWSSVSEMFTLAPSPAEPAAGESSNVASPNPNADASSNSIAPASKEPKPPNQGAAPSLPSTSDPTSTTGQTASPQPPSSIEPNQGNPSTPDTPPQTVNPVAQWLPADANAMQAVLLVHAGNLPLHAGNLPNKSIRLPDFCASSQSPTTGHDQRTAMASLRYNSRPADPADTGANQNP